MCLKKRTMTGITFFLLLSLSACQRPTETDVEKEAVDQTASEKQTTPADPKPPKVDEPPPKPTMPVVKLTEALEATCLVKVGDTLPEGTIADRDARVVEASSLLGPKLTVLCFWNAESMSALQELNELEKYVAVPYSEAGVRIVGINHKDSSQVVADKLELAGATYPNYLDPTGDFFAKFATEGLPRTYLLDPDGKVLWFDTEYSQSTRRDLIQAIEFVLNQ